MAERCWAVIAAGGVGARMAIGQPKQYLPLGGKTVIEHTLARIGEHAAIRGVVVAIARDDPYWPKLQLDLDTPVWTTEGGAERCHSVLAGLRYLAAKASPGDWVLVHDAARPCLRPGDITKLIQELAAHPVGGLLAAPVRDTMKRARDDGQVIETMDRTGLWHALTPQMFRLAALTRALEMAITQGVLVTDEAQAMELSGFSPRLVEGHVDNIKITRPQDLGIAELYLKRQEEE